MAQIRSVIKRCLCDACGESAVVLLEVYPPWAPPPDVTHNEPEFDAEYWLKYGEMFLHESTVSTFHAYLCGTCRESVPLTEREPMLERRAAMLALQMHGSWQIRYRLVEERP